MGILNIFRRKESTASLAKDRLQLVIAHERTNRAGPAYLPMMKQDIVNVIRKYVPITEEEVVVNMESDGNCDVLELNISLPQVASARSPAKK